MSVSARRAIVVGGSLAGLFTATALRSIGWRVSVFERSPATLDSRGGGIVLQPDVLAAFRFAGMSYDSALGVRSDDRVFIDRADNVRQRLSMPQTQTSWSRLHGLLARALPQDVVQRGETLTSIERSPGSVMARFASGRVEIGDLLVGADGPMSTVRRLEFPDVCPVYAGYVAWRGLLPELAASERSIERLAGAFAFQDGPGFQFLTYLVPGEDDSTAPARRRWNWVWHRRLERGAPFAAAMTDKDGRRRSFSIPPGKLRSEVADELRKNARRQLAASLDDLVERTEEPFAQAILDLRVPRMANARVVMLGDAAFIARPHVAGGAAKAANDAVELARALHSIADIDVALARWNDQQMRLGIAMCDRGVALGNRILRSEGPKDEEI